jgi:hypothetical protein
MLSAAWINTIQVDLLFTASSQQPVQRLICSANHPNFLIEELKKKLATSDYSVAEDFTIEPQSLKK